MTVLTYDLETCTETLFKRKASCFHPDNYIVASGFKRDGEPVFGSYFTSQEHSDENYKLPIEDSDTLLIGFNIKFDLMYSWERPELQDFFRRGGQIWDCQYAEYLLEGHRQHSQMCSMDSVIESYGGTLKIDEVKELWKAGINTPDIDESLLMDYLLGTEDGEVEGDVNNTYKIFQGQVKRAKAIHPNFLSMLARRMDGLLATTEMEYNGLKVDRVRGEADRERLATIVSELEQELERYIPELPPELIFNWQSIYHKSYLIYGGAAKYKKWIQHEEDGVLLFANKTEKWPLFEGNPVDPTDNSISLSDDGLYRRTVDMEVQDTFKSGKQQGKGKTKNVTVPDLSKPKGAKQDHTFTFKGYTSAPKGWASTLTDGKDNPIYSTSGDNLEILTQRNADTPFLLALGKRNKAKKDLGTYYWFEDPKTKERKGMLTLVNDDGYIHHKLNHTNTITSRLSSNDPNMQNIPRGDKSTAKAMFVSRFGSKGRMVEIDYSQLEVVIQAVLTRDKQMIVDLQNGIDFHCKRLAAKLNMPYDEVVKRAKDETNEHYPEYSQLRTAIKGFTFQRAYGAGAQAIADSTGMTVEEVEELIRGEELLYPGITAFDAIIEQSINSSRKITKRELFVAGQRFNAAIGEWFSPTGTRYVWTENEVPKFLHKRGKFVGFSPTERKNWPVQGDGGFVVQAMLGYLFRYFNKQRNFNGNAFIVNTVHDCVWLDVHEDYIHTVVPAAKAILESVPTMYKRAFNIDIPVKFPTDAEIGLNMLDLEHYIKE